MNQIVKNCLGCIDLTSLNATDTETSIVSMVEKVNELPLHFPGLDNVAAVCVFPSFARIVRKRLTAPKVRLAVTGAGFPSSHTFLKIKVEECKMAMDEGADEIDIVLPLSLFLSQNHDMAITEMAKIKKAIGETHLKVILETGVLPNPESIATASRIAMDAGADFIKTSTGKVSPAATPEAATVMCQEIKGFYNKTGKKIGFKPAGGIVTVDDAIAYYTIVHDILGAEWLTPQLFRIGASRLTNNLLTAITGREVSYF
ncbi:MAG: deoxyribose-phosphate aldolase [Prevotellaceae bacterium]|jgi:deoxyribose-phosphate aldolase|nr:deoxyribose-phosphate aldolase [Prevotellaceae bacterium]